MTPATAKKRERKRQRLIAVLNQGDDGAEAT
jgi:hypothetical protein